MPVFMHCAQYFSPSDNGDETLHLITTPHFATFAGDFRSDESGGQCSWRDCRLCRRVDLWFASALHSGMLDTSQDILVSDARQLGVWQYLSSLILPSVCYLQPIAANGEIANQDECNEYLCNQETYNQLLACLNCIVANGDERPRGYHTNSALTAPASDDALGPAATPIGGYLDADQGNGWLANVTERCGSVGRSLNNLTTTLTATPTTT